LFCLHSLKNWNNFSMSPPLSYRVCPAFLHHKWMKKHFNFFDSLNCK
jgi:hypothetical protein